MVELTLAIVGIDFPNADRRRTNRRSALMMLAPGTPLDLRPEPTNPHDEHAVAVFAVDGHQLGYLSAERAPFIAARMRRGEDVRAIFQGMTAAGAFLRVRIGGGDPTLPPRRAAPDTDEPRIDDRDDLAQPDGPLWGA